MKCAICGKEPKDITEYQEQAEIEGMTPEEFVQNEEGTYDYSTGYFVCTNCYINNGMPLNYELLSLYKKLKGSYVNELRDKINEKLGEM